VPAITRLAGWRDVEYQSGGLRRGRPVRVIDWLAMRAAV